MNVRRPGSIGCSAYPARVIKGKRMSGPLRATKRSTTKNLELVRIDADRNLLFIKGAVPGPVNGFVQIQTARTGIKKPSPQPHERNPARHERNPARHERNPARQETQPGMKETQPGMKKSSQTGIKKG